MCTNEEREGGRKINKQSERKKEERWRKIE
jgi:hypothetical protein